MKIRFKIEFNEHYWVNRLFRFLPCKHEVVSVEENSESRYGCHTSYKYCLKCGRKAMEIGRHCKHKLNSFGECIYCLERIVNPCEGKEHVWVQDSDTGDYFCKNCGVWKDKEE